MPRDEGRYVNPFLKQDRAVAREDLRRWRMHERYYADIGRIADALERLAGMPDPPGIDWDALQAQCEHEWLDPDAAPDNKGGRYCMKCAKTEPPA